MDPQLERHVIAERAFWAGAGIVVIGGIGSVIAGAGHPNRIAGVLIPFVVAAGGFAVLAVTHQRGRGFTTIAYIVTGLAIVYGLLLVLAVPLRLAVEGTCPPAPHPCTSGAELQLSNTETLALTIAVFSGALALLVGYFGLVAIYRMRPGASAAAAQQQQVWPAQEPAGWRRRAAKAAGVKPAEEAKPAEAPKPSAEATSDAPEAEPPSG